MLGLVDTAIMGHLGSATFIGAIAVGSTMFNMLYWLFAFLRMGTGGLTAQEYGAGNAAGVDTVLIRSLLTAAAIAAVLIVLSGPLGMAAVDFLDADDSVAPYARRYFAIGIWGAPAVLATYVLNGHFLGVQDTRTPMWIAITANVVNILLSVTFVFAAGMDIAGVALGTVIAQWLGAGAGLWITLRRRRPGWPDTKILTDGAALRRLFAINTHILLRTLCLVAVTVWFTRSGASQGVITLSVNALMMQFFMFSSYFSDGFAYAGEALAGAAAGSGAGRGELRRITSALMKWGGGIALAFSAIYFVGGDIILAALTDLDDVRHVAAEYLPWAATIPLCGVTAFIFDGIYIGLTRTRAMLLSMAVATALFFGLYFLLFPTMGNHGLWLAFSAYLVTRGAILAAKV